MSYDCCKKCGVREYKPYQAISKICDDKDCPQRIVRDRLREMFPQVPERKYPFTE